MEQASYVHYYLSIMALNARKLVSWCPPGRGFDIYGRDLNFTRAPLVYYHQQQKIKKQKTKKKQDLDINYCWNLLFHYILQQK